MKLLIGIYSFFLFSFVIFTYLFIDPNLLYLKNLYSEFVFEHRILTTILYVFFISAFFGFYLVFLKAFKNNKINRRNIKIILGITVSVLFFSYPAILSFDIFNYIFTAKVLYFYHENPYIIMPIQFSGDPLLNFTHAANKLALYGPSWIGITSFPFLLGLGNFIITLFLFKFLGLSFYLLTIWVLYAMRKDLFSIAIFLLNPLVLIETLVSGHNDIVMMFFALLAFLCLQRKKHIMATLFITISILIKYSTLFIVPIFLYCLYKDFKEEGINWDKMYKLSGILMLFVFLLSPFREEIYPWYAVWFLIFTPFLSKNNFIKTFSIVFSFSLLLRYIPYMLIGTYDFPTPLIKTALTLTPSLVVLVFIFVKNKLWLKKSRLL